MRSLTDPMNTSESPSSIFSPSPTEPPLSPESARSWCIALHLSGLSGLLLSIVLAHILVPLCIWLLKRAGSPEIDTTGKEVLNFQISYTLYFLIAGMLCFIFVGFLILPLLFIAWLLLPIIAAVKTNNGIFYRYPLTISFLR